MDDIKEHVLTLLLEVISKYRHIFIRLEQITREFYQDSKTCDESVSFLAIIEIGYEEIHINKPALLKFTEVKSLSNNDVFLQMCCLFEIGVDSIMIEAINNGCKSELFDWEQLV
jgi:hypothetical protein